MLELTRLLHVHTLLIPTPVESLVQQPLTLHEVNLQVEHSADCQDRGI